MHVEKQNERWNGTNHSESVLDARPLFRQIASVIKQRLWEKPLFN